MCTYGLINRRSIGALDAPHVGAQSPEPSPLTAEASKRISQAYLRGGRTRSAAHVGPDMEVLLLLSWT